MVSPPFATAKVGDDFPFRDPQFHPKNLCQSVLIFFEKNLGEKKMRLSAKYRRAQRNY